MMMKMTFQEIWQSTLSIASLTCLPCKIQSKRQKEASITRSSQNLYRTTSNIRCFDYKHTSHKGRKRQRRCWRQKYFIIFSKSPWGKLGHFLHISLGSSKKERRHFLRPSVVYRGLKKGWLKHHILKRRKTLSQMLNNWSAVLKCLARATRYSCHVRDLYKGGCLESTSSSAGLIASLNGGPHIYAVDNRSLLLVTTRWTTLLYLSLLITCKSFH